MFQFLYLFGPGIMTWYVINKYANKKWVFKESSVNNNVLYVLAEVIVYSLVNIAIVTTIFKPFGRVQFAVLANGKIDLQYGATAFLASMVLAVAIGIGGPFAVSKIKDNWKDSAYDMCGITMTILFCHHMLSSFRWPSDYVLTCHVVSYRFGWLPRGIIGTLGALFFGNRWYSRQCMDVVIMGTAAIFAIWFISECIIYAHKCKSFVGMIIFLIFALSPHARFYVNVMGYFEQYGYALCILLMFILPKLSTKKNIIVSASVGFLALLISETNMFLIVPILFADTFICIINDEESGKIKKDLVFLILSYIPHIVLSIVIWVVKTPLSVVEKLQAYDKSHVTDFVFRDDVHYYFYERSNPEIWPRMLRPIPGWCVIYPLLLIVFVAVVIYYEKDMKLLLSYTVLAVAAGVCSYLLVIVAWDLDRFFFGIFMSVFFISAFVTKKYLCHIKPKKKYIEAAFAVLIVLVPLSMNRFALFDNTQYHTNIHDLWISFMSRF